jgi:hypothetical protein
MSQKEYFEIKLGELQSLGKWAADCSIRSLAVYERLVNGDDRPRNALLGIQEFSTSGKRTNRLRKLALDAYRASLETKEPSASAAAQSASLAAASAYTHPFKDVNQSKHILGPAAYSALALELDGGSDPQIGEREITLAIEGVTVEIVGLLTKMPPQPPGKTRLDQLYQRLDIGIRNPVR